jgi:glycosyltransferase involved in cell wall biosynthesis
MRIVVDLQSCQNGSRYRGIGRYSMAITKAMIALGRKHDFVIFLSDRYPDTIAEIRRAFDGILPQDKIVVCSFFKDLCSAPPANAWRSRAAETIRTEFIARLEPDLVFVPSLFEGFWDDVVVSIDRPPFPVALTLHDLIPLEDTQLYLPEQRDQDAYFRKLQGARNADLVVCISHYVAEEAAELIGVDPARLAVVLNGVDEAFQPPAPGAIDRAGLMERLGIKRPFVFNTSPFEHRKNLHGLISGFASMPRSVRDAHQIVIAGRMNDHARRSIAELARAEGLAADAVLLPGHVSDEDLIALYSECALFAFPALSEGFGLPPLEAMACGAPVIASSTTSLPEVIGREDMMVDPYDPTAIGAAMERVLTDPARQADLRAYGLERARQFPWQRSAERTLDAFEALHRKRKPGKRAAPDDGRRARIAFACPTMERASELAGRTASLIAQLAVDCDLTLFCEGGASQDSWALARIEKRALDDLYWDAGRFDAIVYACDRRPDEDFARLMADHPGILLLLEGMDAARSAGSQAHAMPGLLQRGLHARGGLGGLVGPAARDIAAGEMPELLAAGLAASARKLLREGSDGLPLLPLFGSEPAGLALREGLGIAPDATLIAAIAGSEAGGAELVRQFRSSHASSRAAHLVLFAGDGEDGSAAQDAVQLPGGVHRPGGPLSDHYRALLSTANLLLVSRDIDAGLGARLAADAEALRLHSVFEGETPQHLAERLADHLQRRANAPAGPKPVAAPVNDPTIMAWGRRVLDAVAKVRAQRPLPEAGIAAGLPGSVRGVRPSANDVAAVAGAISTNAALSRAPAYFIDLTAYAATGASRRVDPVAKAHLIALLKQGGRAIHAIVHDGGHFVVANQLVGELLGLPNFFLPDERFVARPGDRVIGLDLFHSFGTNSFAALHAAHDRGALLLYLADGEASLAGGHEDTIARLLLTWSKQARPTMRGKIGILQPAAAGEPADSRLTALIGKAAAARLPIEILAFEGLAQDDLDHAAGLGFAVAKPSKAVRSVWAEEVEGSPAAPPAELDFAVMGHLVGSYSLALINRTVARTLERWRPGHVRFLPYETVPIFHTEGVPAAEKELMATLSARPAPIGGDEIVIAQHWPIMAPTIRHRLALSLLPWEESHVPDGIVATLNDGFDAIIAPSQSVADALTISGVRLPVAAIGQPVEIERFQALAEGRTPRKRIRRFLHVSSCFRRKGVDLLLAAWAKAFTAQDGVTLVIKTFPNPHNDVEAQVAELRRRHPRLARIEIVNRDADCEEMPDFYFAADAMVLPTRGEGYNLPALEAMAAGLPLIVTGHGGHRDFCGPDNARLLKYRFERSASHVAGNHSMWAEPSLDDLVLALRELADPANADAIETRRLNAIAAAAAEGDGRAWTRRLHGLVDSLLTNKDQSAPRIGWVSTWQITCGIAQYSTYLLDRMSPAVRRRMTIICDDRSPAAKGEIAHDAVWKLIGDKADEIVQAARRHEVEALLIQHQDGLISWEQLGQIGRNPALADMVSVAMLHNVRTLLWKVKAEDLPDVIAGLARMTRILVHNIEDLNLLLGMGLDRNVGLFPHGAMAPSRSPWPRAISRDDAPIIGCHGFFFRHKGIDKLIRAAAMLRQDWPGLRLRLVNARFPGPEHDEVIEECRAIAAEVGMEDAVEWHLDFLPVERVEALLSECDMIVLPYDESDDSASGAVRTSLSTMVPLLATRVKIFGDLGAAVAWADDNDPETLARAIAPLLRSREKRREIQAGMHDWLSAHDWQKMATTLENMMHGLVRQKRLGRSVADGVST